MRFTAIASISLGLVACVWADTINVKVGDGGGLTFTPQSVTAKQGDVIAFQFISGDHSVTQSSFANPCTKLTTPTLGIDSDYQPVTANAMTPQWNFTVNATTPLWFYCKQGGHCKAGMVFAVNPTTDETFDAFKAKATGASPPSSSGSSSTASVPSPSPSTKSSNAATLNFNPSNLAGVVTLVAILAGSVF